MSDSIITIQDPKNIEVLTNLYKLTGVEELNFEIEADVEEGGDIYESRCSIDENENYCAFKSKCDEIGFSEDSLYNELIVFVENYVSELVGYHFEYPTFVSGVASLQLDTARVVLDIEVTYRVEDTETMPVPTTYLDVKHRGSNFWTNDIQEKLKNSILQGTAVSRKLKL